MTQSWLPIRYRDFFDVPRMFVVESAGRLFLLDAPFDEVADAYADSYTVYLLPEASRREVEAESWAELGTAGDVIGRVAVADVSFDESRRRLVSDEFLQLLQDF